MKIDSQNVWPSLENDFYSILDRLSFLLPAGFQYRRFIRPRFLWPVQEKLIRKIAGLGKLPRNEISQVRKPTEEVSPDIIVIGGGPAGMTAALEAGKLGAGTLLIDDSSKLGGRLRLQTSKFEGLESWNGMRGFRIAEEIATEISRLDNVRVLLGSTALGYYSENVFTAETPERLLVVRPRKIIVATGCYDRPAMFFNNDLPGIFLPIGLQRLMHEYGVRPGSHGVIATNNDFGYELANNMVDAGVTVRAILDERKSSASKSSANAEVLAGSTIVEAAGRKYLSGVRLRTSGGRSRSLPCDVVCVACGTYPSNELLFQVGAEMRYSTEAGGYIPARDSNMLVMENCYAIGGAAGTNRFRAAVLEGKIAGASACFSLSIKKDEAASTMQAAMRQLDAKTNSGCVD